MSVKRSSDSESPSSALVTSVSVKNGSAKLISPKKEIHHMNDMITWQHSEALHDLFSFVLLLNDSIKGKEITMPFSESEIINKLFEVLERLDLWVDEVPPSEQPQRFGNASFRIWHKQVTEQSEEMLRTILPERCHLDVLELNAYFLDSFGNVTRLDYGTGHELSFAMFLCCLYKIEVISDKEARAVVFKIFYRYLLLVEKLQLTYMLEPAGSHGTGSLDDFQFLPYIWGSSQLIGHSRLYPENLVDRDIAEAYCKEYLFFHCILFIHKVKTGPFNEHSNALWNLSKMASWSKINVGLIKMYLGEVLTKFPIVQHVLFGSLLSIKIKENPNPNITKLIVSKFP